MDGEEHRSVVLLVVHVEVSGTHRTFYLLMATTLTILGGGGTTVVLECYVLSGMEPTHGRAHTCLIATALIGLGGTCALHFACSLATMLGSNSFRKRYSYVL
jgi:hypothetical protein